MNRYVADMTKINIHIYNADGTFINNNYTQIPVIKKVIFNPPATIVFWEDGAKTVVKCQDMIEEYTDTIRGGGQLLAEYKRHTGTEIFDKEKGLAMAFCKKAMGNNRGYYEMFKKWCGED